MSIAQNISEIESSLPASVKLIAVSKTKPNADILEAYAAGQRDFGENYIQELQDKQPALPADINWHFIGHLQSNKVKYIAPYVYLIHGVDSLKLLTEINRQAAKNNRTINCLLQIYIAKEESKFGLSEEEATALLTSEVFKSLTHVCIVGLMGMASFSNDLALVENEFASLKKLYDKLSAIKADNLKLAEISMGMSGDYQLAIKHGSTIVRIGSSIFGSR